LRDDRCKAIAKGLQRADGDLAVALTADCRGLHLPHHASPSGRKPVRQNGDRPLGATFRERRFPCGIRKRKARQAVPACLTRPVVTKLLESGDPAFASAGRDDQLAFTAAMFTDVATLPGYRFNPAISVLIWKRVLPAVIYSVRISGPPNAVFVIRSSGIGMKRSSLPCGEIT